jgi:hypothetical protein
MELLDLQGLQDWTQRKLSSHILFLDLKAILDQLEEAVVAGLLERLP